MIKDKISNFEFGALNYFIVRAFLIGVTFNCIINLIKQDGWVTPLAGIIVGTLFILAIVYIMNYKPDLNLGEKLISLFNKKIGIVIISISCIFAFMMCILNYLNLNNFIHGQFLNKTPVIAISVLFIFATFYILTKGINTICRTGVILFYISFFTVIVTIIGLLPTIEFSNLKPMFQSNPSDYLGALNCYYAYNVTPIFLLTIIPKNNINNPKLKTALSISYIVSAITLFFVLFITLATFGYELSMLYQYPEFHVLKQISLIGVSARIESILVIQWLFDLLMLNIFIIYFVASNINIIIKTKKINTIYFILCVLLVIGSNFLSRYNVFLNNLTFHDIPLPTTIFTIIITSVICLKIKTSKSKKKKENILT